MLKPIVVGAFRSFKAIDSLRLLSGKTFSLFLATSSLSTAGVLLCCFAAGSSHFCGNMQTRLQETAQENPLNEMLSYAFSRSFLALRTIKT